MDSTAVLRLSQVALAVEQFRASTGQLPHTLDQLIPKFFSSVPNDPFDGKSLRYRRLPTGYVVYSIGSDGNDDGGRKKPANQKSTDKTPYDITITVER